MLFVGKRISEAAFGNGMKSMMIFRIGKTSKKVTECLPKRLANILKNSFKGQHMPDCQDIIRLRYQPNRKWFFLAKCSLPYKVQLRKMLSSWSLLEDLIRRLTFTKWRHKLLNDIYFVFLNILSSICLPNILPKRVAKVIKWQRKIYFEHLTHLILSYFNSCLLSFSQFFSY